MVKPATKPYLVALLALNRSVSLEAAASLLVIDDLFLRRLPPSDGDELADVLMSRYEKSSAVVTSN